MLHLPLLALFFTYLFVINAQTNTTKSPSFSNLNPTTLNSSKSNTVAFGINALEELTTTSDYNDEMAMDFSSIWVSRSSRRRSNTSLIAVTTTEPSTTTADGVIVFDFCHSTSFTKNHKKIALILLYVSSGWVGGWSALVILINACNGVVGHYRMLNMLQEFSIIIIFGFMGGLVMKTDPTKLCEITSVVLYAVMIYILMMSLMTTSIARSLIRGGSSRNGRLPAATYYFWPVFLSIVITVLVYFTMRTQFQQRNGVHCFSDIYEGRYWAYSITAVFLSMAVLLMNQTSILLCKMTRNSVNLTQLFWAKKTIRAEPLNIMGFLACYFCLMFAVAMQKLWLFGVYTGICIIYGVMFFIIRTYCYEETAKRMYSCCHLCFYKPCPKVIRTIRPKTPKHRLLALKRREELAASNMSTTSNSTPIASLGPAPKIKLIEPSEPSVSLPPQPAATIAAPSVPKNEPTDLAPVEPNDTSAQDFYKWLTDGNEGNIAHSENVLFNQPTASQM